MVLATAASPSPPRRGPRAPPPPRSALPRIFAVLGVAGTFGLGVAGLSGGGAEYLGDVPGTFINNDSGQYFVLGVNLGAGFQLTDRFSVGATMTLGTGFEQLGLVGPIVGSAMVNAYALRGTFGFDYALNDCNTLGFYYQSKMSFDFANGIRVGTNYYDCHIAQPTTLGLGIANRSLMDGNLLIAADVYYKLWDDAALWQDVMVNQWAFAVGRSSPATTEIPRSDIPTIATPSTTTWAAISTVSGT